jgi:hypothetical protein
MCPRCTSAIGLLCSMLGVSVRRMKAFTGKVEPVTLIFKGSYHLTCFVY